MVISYQSASSSTTGVSSTTSSSAVTLASSSQGTETTYTGPGSATETANSSSLGLKLTLSVNSTMIPSQDAIDITTSVLNTLPTANNLTASNAWAIGGLSAGPCDLGNSTNKLFFPVGIGVFRGTYGLNNLSSAGSRFRCGPLWNVSPMASSVGNQYYALHSITSYSLLPGSDNGTYAGYYAVPGTPPPPVCNSGVCTYTADTTESFAKGVIPNADGRPGDASTPLTAPLDWATIHSGRPCPANYTLVAGDEWGQLTHSALLCRGVTQPAEGGELPGQRGRVRGEQQSRPMHGLGVLAGVHLQLRRPGRYGLWMHHPGPLLGAVERHELHHNREVPVHRPAWGARGGQLHVQRAWRHGVSVRILLHGQLYGIRPESVEFIIPGPFRQMMLRRSCSRGT